MCLPVQAQGSPVHCHMPDSLNLVGLSQFVGELSVQLCTQAKKFFFLQLQLVWLHTSPKTTMFFCSGCSKLLFLPLATTLAAHEVQIVDKCAIWYLTFNVSECFSVCSEAAFLWFFVRITLPARCYVSPPLITK